MSGSVRQGSGSEIKLAGSESKDKMYEPKHKKKLIRVLTVIAYVFSVSLAAITLSLFYIFIYNPDRPAGRLHGKHQVPYSNDTNARVEDERNMLNRTWLAPEEPRALPVHLAEPPQIMHDLVQLTSNESPDSWEPQDLYKTLRGKRSTKKFIKKLKMT